MKNLLLIFMILLISNVSNALTYDEIDKLEMDNSLYPLMKKVASHCEFKIEPKEDEDDARSNFERMKILKRAYLNFPSGDLISLGDLKFRDIDGDEYFASEIEKDSCEKPDASDLEDKLPELKAELVVARTEELRVQKLKKRIADMKFFDAAHHRMLLVHSDYPKALGAMKLKLFKENMLSVLAEYEALSEVIEAEYVESQGEEQSLKDIQFGQRIVALFSYLNKKGNITKVQVKELSRLLSPIKELLESGSIPTARDEIAQITPSTLLTEAKKSKILARIDAYLEK